MKVNNKTFEKIVYFAHHLHSQSGLPYDVCLFDAVAEFVGVSSQFLHREMVKDLAINIIKNEAIPHNLEGETLRAYCLVKASLQLLNKSDMFDKISFFNHSFELVDEDLKE